MDKDLLPIRQRIIDLLDTAERQSQPRCSHFLSPAEQGAAEVAARREGWSGVTQDSAGWVFHGGVPGAERRRFCVIPFAPGTEDPEEWIDLSKRFCVVEIWTSPQAGPGPGHRDILGAVLACGIRRDFVGDIAVDPARGLAWIVLDPAVLDTVLTSVDRIERCAVRLRAVPLEQYPAGEDLQEKERITGTVATPRLDAVLALAFRLSRSDAAEHIRSGDVQLNWIVCTDPDKLLSQGDRIALRGRGKAVLAEMGGHSRKGRQFIAADRFR